MKKDTVETFCCRSGNLALHSRPRGPAYGTVYKSSGLCATKFYDKLRVDTEKYSNLP